LDALEQGLAASQRIFSRISIVLDRSARERDAKLLETRVADWKGHHFENFGELLLEARLRVTSSDILREYHVFLFEKILLCFKEAPIDPPKSAEAEGAQSTASRGSPLLLKGRVFLNVITQTVPVMVDLRRGT
jgi:cell division control protein 24